MLNASPSRYGLTVASIYLSITLHTNRGELEIWSLHFLFLRGKKFQGEGGVNKIVSPATRRSKVHVCVPESLVAAAA